MFKIITETQDFIIASKSAGINFHDEGDLGSGLFSLVKAQVKAQRNQTSSSTELFPVHRLDKMTSGLIIFAKTLNCAQAFQEMFAQHKVEKYYLAISDKKPNKKQGLIKGDMAKSRRGMWKLLRTVKNPAITQFVSYSLGNSKRLYLLKPHSGKTHQLRVALSSIGAPIIGDSTYHASSKADRGYLHAYALRFSYMGKNFEFVELPAQGLLYLESAVIDKLNELTQPWLESWPKL